MGRKDRGAGLLGQLRTSITSLGRLSWGTDGSDQIPPPAIQMKREGELSKGLHGYFTCQ